jgi:hypothetical protein
MAANKINDETKRKFLTVYAPDTRGTTLARYGRGNLKIGMEGVYTYSRLPGAPGKHALGIGEIGKDVRVMMPLSAMRGTCPGATAECQAICYAARPVEAATCYENMLPFVTWQHNSTREDVPPIPDDCKILRIHVSGDFTSPSYIHNWFVRLNERPDVRAFAYTRSWRVPELLPHLEELRKLPNMQLFASMDKSTTELPPADWRRAWIADDERLDHCGTPEVSVMRNHNVWNGGERVGVSFTCPEETGHKANCEECRYCIDGKRNDVTFLKH